MQIIRKLKYILFLGFLLSLSSSFALAASVQYLRTQESGVTGTLQSRTPLVEYYIAPGDTMEIFVWEKPVELLPAEKAAPEAEEAGKEYKIVPGDGVEVFVWQNPDVSKVVIVDPDGRISYPLIGRFEVAGLTIKQLEDKMTEEMSRYIKSPQISVMIRTFGGEKKKEELTKKGNILGEMNPPKDVTVGPDGNISYPLVGRVKAAGLTPAQLETRLSEELSKYIKLAQVSIMMRTFTGNKIIILGQVAAPGIYTYQGDLNLLEAVALAGDFTDDARTDSIIVVHNNLTETPEVVRVNLFRAIHKGTSKPDVILMPNDVVYVPKTFIANFNKFLNDIQPSVDTAMSIFDWRKEIRAWYKHVAASN
ncbi:MAG: polysaccharide biosynthesis/export family protein [Candidatus Omnitrophica bacterium]|nr:polysaccharide biosynthesis/export family protein [Candidatus Omnitrophota bacterium]